MRIQAFDDCGIVLLTQIISMNPGWPPVPFVRFSSPYYLKISKIIRIETFEDYLIY